MLKRLPLVSVCITAYNHGGYIIQCVQSVLDQKGDFEIEILVGDDGSSDETRQILMSLSECHPDRIKVFFHPQNLGASGNLCFLISRAEGQFIAHLDGDDYWLADKLQRQLILLAEHPDCVAVYGNGLVVNDEGKHFARFHSPLKAKKLYLTDIVERGNFLFHSSLLYRSANKDVILSIPGGFIDFRMHIRLASIGPVLLINQPVAVYRHASSSSMIRHMPNLVFQYYWQALQEAAQLGVSGPAHNAAGLFWERIFISSLRNLAFSNIMKWWRICGERQSVRLGVLRRTWLMVRSLRLVFIALHARLQSPAQRVLYRR